MPPEPRRPARLARGAVALLLLGAAGLAAAGCASAPKRRAPEPGWTERGVASWYGPGFHGKITANGEVYDMDRLTAAHPSLPFGSLVEVRNLDNGRRVRVRINDRGPFVGGRVIDLSRAAAKEIRMVGPGTARVELRMVAAGAEPAGRGRYRVQAGAFRDPERARALAARLEADYPGVAVRAGGGWHRVEIGPLARRQEAEEIVRDLAALGIEAVVRR